jgi:hypothetical protein
LDTAAHVPAYPVGGGVAVHEGRPTIVYCGGAIGLATVSGVVTQFAVVLVVKCPWVLIVALKPLV